MPARIDSFLRLVVDQRASDLHLHAGSVPRIRLDGDLLPLPFRALTSEQSKRFLYEIMTPAQRETFERDFEVDFSYGIEGVGRFRANVFMQLRGPGAVFRVIANEIPTATELGLPRVVRKLAQLQNGLVLVTGPTGSGKTTTLAAIIHEINRSSARHIITIEDPIEYLHPSLASLITQREVGQHAESFSSALRSALREAPDVLVVGEMRDLETAMLALSAAETGVLVFGTLHTGSAAKSIDRIIDLAPEESQAQVRSTLSTTLRAVIAQDLVKRASGEGVIPAIEVLLPSFALSHMIRENKGHLIDGHIQSSEGEGSDMQSFDGSLARLVRQGLVDIEEAAPMARNPDAVRRAALLPED
ncbi:MAG TPA: type IV pilus twitching motility protein PilT [Polyangiaceae bacterium]|jgi:twitching motility protein PilT|nr:type IV pilus twitching motility protein PilT [Polyangiaceae bacterium]